MAAPSFAMGDTNTGNIPAPIEKVVDAVRSALPGAKAPAADATTNSGGGVAAIGAAPTPPSTIVMPSTGLGGGSAAGGNFGVGMFGSGGIPARPAPLAPQTNLSPPPRPTFTSPVPVHPLPPPIPRPVAPPVVRIPPVIPPPVVVVPRPPIMHPPVIVVPPFRTQPFPFGRPMVSRPFVGGGGFARRR